MHRAKTDAPTPSGLRALFVWRGRKYSVARTVLWMSFGALLAGHLSGGEFVTIVCTTLAAFGAAHVAQDWGGKRVSE